MFLVTIKLGILTIIFRETIDKESLIDLHAVATAPHDLLGTKPHEPYWISK